MTTEEPDAVSTPPRVFLGGMVIVLGGQRSAPVERPASSRYINGHWLEGAASAQHASMRDRLAVHVPAGRHCLADEEDNPAILKLVVEAIFREESKRLLPSRLPQFNARSESRKLSAFIGR